MAIRKTKQDIHREEIIDKIIETAEKLFQTYGYEKTSVRDIANEAGVTTGTLYHHFANKNDIILETFKRYHALSFTNNLPSDDPLQELTDCICVKMVDHILADGLDFTQYRIMKLLKPNTSTNFEKYIFGLVSQCQQKGLLTQELSASDITDSIISLHRGAVFEYCMSPDTVNLAAVSSRRFHILLRAFT